MKHSFGIVVGRAAMVKPGKEIFLVSCVNEKAAHFVKKTMATVKSKLPCKSKIFFEERE
jgi:ribosomal protein L16/L10AE